MTGSVDGDDSARTPAADEIQARRAPGPGLLSRLPGMAYQCRNDPEWTLEFVSAGALDLTGYDPDELVGEDGPSYGDLIHADDRQAVWDQVQAALAEKRPFELDYRIRHRSGEIRWVWEQGHGVLDPEGEVLGLEGFIIDATARRSVRRRLEDSLRMLRTLVDQNLFGVYVIQDGVFRYVNEAFTRIFGYEREEIVDRLGPADLTAPSDRERVLRNVRRRADGEIESLQYSFQGLRRDGSEVPVEVHGGRADLRGRPAASGVLLDMSEKQVLEEQLRQTQKREALAELTGSVAHDFNNFLTGVIGSVEMATWDVEPGSEAARNLTLAGSTAQRAAALTRRLLSFARNDVGHPRTFDLNEEVEDITSLLHQLVGSPIRLELELAPEPLWVHLDPGHVEQIVMNLVVNARDALPEGGRIVVRTGAVEASLDQHRALVEVEDDGQGMDAETRARIFSPFFTTKKTGTGLGLATVRKIVDGAGGDVEVESEPGRGATFRVRIPRVEGPSDDLRGEADGGASGSALLPDAHVLVVEDDDAVRRMIEAALTRHGCRVEAVRNAEEAVERARDGERPFHALLTDISLPDRSGIEVARAVLGLHPGLPVVFSSGYAESEWPDGGWPDREAEILRKPYAVDDLVEVVGRALARRDNGRDDERAATGDA